MPSVLVSIQRIRDRWDNPGWGARPVGAWLSGMRGLRQSSLNLSLGDGHALRLFQQIDSDCAVQLHVLQAQSAKAAPVDIPDLAR